MDHDVKNTLEDEKVASALVGHGWAFKTPESWEKYRVRAKDVDYNFDPELDENIRASLTNTKNAEMAKGPDFSLFSALQLQDDPCYSSLGNCVATLPPGPDRGYPIDYKVPSFGPDPDMVGTMENERIASAMLDHAWEFNTKRSFEKWRNRALDTKDDYNFNPELDDDVRATHKFYTKAEDEYGSWDVDKTTAHMGYDYYEYQADRD
jgi:hypothetical protein